MSNDSFIYNYLQFISFIIIQYRKWRKLNYSYKKYKTTEIKNKIKSFVYKYYDNDLYLTKNEKEILFIFMYLHIPLPTITSPDTETTTKLKLKSVSN
jgi:hypothetical protein